MEQGGTWQAFVSTGIVKTYLDYKKAQQKEEEHADRNSGPGAAGSESGRG